MGGGGGSPQMMLNPSNMVQQQTQSNVQTGVANAYLGNTNQVTPYGNLTYAQTGTQNIGGNNVPTFTATQTLSPEQQAIYDKTTGLQSGALDTAGDVLKNVTQSVNNPVDPSKAPALPQNQDALRDSAFSAMMARQNQTLDTQQQQQRVALLNQGIHEGTTAWDNAMRPIQQARVDATNQATLNAGNLAGQNLAQAQQLHDAYIADQSLVHDQPINDYAKLLGFGGSTTSPTYASPTNATIANTDTYAPYIQQSNLAMQQYGMDRQAGASTMGAIAGLGGSALMAGAYFF